MLIWLFIEEIMGIFDRNKKKESASPLTDQLNQSDLIQLFAIILVDNHYRIKEVNQLFLENFSCTTADVYGKDIRTINAKAWNGENANLDFWNDCLGSNISSVCASITSFNNEVITGRLKIIPKSNGDFLLLFDPVEFQDNILTDTNNTNKLFFELIKNIPDIICFKDGTGRWLLANDADLELFNLTKVDYKGKTDAELAAYTHAIYKDSFLNCMETDENCWNRRAISRGDEKIPLSNGKERIYDVFKIPVFNEDGSRKNLIVLGRDVTERRQMEEELREAKLKAEESDKLKSNFLATMSHELRTPLNAVIGFSNLIYEEDDIDEIHDFSRIINNNSNMLLNLIEDLFDISLIESQQLKLELGVFDIVHTIKEVFEIFPVEMEMLNKLNIDLKLSVEHQQLLVKGDVFRTKQVLTNLIRNALKFTKEGSIIIQLEDESDFASIKVIDSGIGISEDKLKEIFEKFKQVEEGFTRSFGGAGLGLFISKNLALLMGGDISVSSKPGEGSVFSLKLQKDINLHNR